MNTIKRYTLSGAALLALAGGAQAADLPSFKSAPVEYVRVCDAFGAGFFYIPGTDTCLRISGAIRAEYTVRSGAPTDNQFAFARNLAGTTYPRDLTSMRARSYTNADARTQTAYGTIRTYVSIRITVDSTPPGPYGGGSYTPSGSTFSQKTSLFQGYNNRSWIFLDKAFIQFAGITAGRAQSFFDFDAQSRELLSNTIANSNQVSSVFAYTYAFGGGYSGTISVEDRNDRAIADNGFLQSNLNPTTTKAGYQAYAGETVPDVVANLRADETWGSAQLAAAYHQVSSLPVQPNSTGPMVTPKSQDGFAALAGVKVLAPFIAKGDNFTLQGTYELGAMDYLNPLNYQTNGLSNVYSHNTSVSPPVNDAFIGPGGTIKMNRGYGAYAAFQHYWAPDWNSSLFGDYATIRDPYSAQLLGAGTDNAKIYQIGGNLIWTPVKDLIIGGEVLYTNLHLSGAANLSTANTTATGTKIPLSPDSDEVRGRLSLRRAF